MSRVKVLQDDVKQNCLSLVKGYARRREEYKQRRMELMSVSPDNHVTVYRDKKDPFNVDKQIGAIIPSTHNASRTTEDIAARIAGLEDLPETKRMRAVEYAAKRIGQDLNEKDRKQLVDAIFRSCIDGRKYPFERLAINGMERSCFYARRMKFLVDIAKFMEMI